MAPLMIDHADPSIASPETRLAAFEAAVSDIVRALESCEIGFLETMVRLRQAINASRASRQKVAA